MRTTQVVVILILLAAGLLPPSAYASGVVTVCDEAHLLAALAGGGTVTFACSGVITLTNTIVVSGDTTIDGSGQDVTISGNNAVRVFAVNSGVTLDLNELTVAHGSSAYDTGGGGISNDGILNLTNIGFVGNSAGYDGGGGAIFNNAGTVTVSQCVFSDNNAPGPGGGGGAIKNEGAMTVSSSSFLANSAPSSTGGGIYNSGTLTVTDSMLSDNNAGTAGGIFNSVTLIVSNSTLLDNRAVSQGGGIYTYYGALTVSNSTFSGNRATDGGGMGSYGGTVTVSNSTFFGNSATYGGGISRGYDSTVTLSNTIVANSTTGGNCYGAITDGDGNLSYPDSTCPGINADPKLGPLQNTGGPTLAMPLLLGSAALDAGDDAVCAAPPVNGLDQRGFIRPAGSHCDIGAVEQRLVTTCDEVHLREMVAVGGTVDFACSGTVTLSSTLTIAMNTTLEGNGYEVTISGNNAVRVFTVNAGVTLSIDKLSVANGSAGTTTADSGGGIRSDGGMLIVSNSNFIGNSAPAWKGGAISNSNHGTVTVRNVRFSGNSADISGGAIYNENGTLTVSNSTFTGNSARQSAGAIYSENGTLTVSNSTFSANHALDGGGIVNLDTLTLSNSTFSGNTGGGISNVARTGMIATGVVINSTLRANSGGLAGITNNGGVLTLKNTIVASTQGRNCLGTITDGGGNLSYPDSTCPGINADPRLGPLQDNGGPTWTMALGSGSAAIDAADDATCAADLVSNRDQRGVVRPQGVHCDIGAFERPTKWLPIMLVE